MFNLEGKWPNKVEEIGATLGLSEIQTADYPPVHDIIHGREPVYLLSFIPSASDRSNSFTILSPSPLLGVETPPAGPGNLRRIHNIQLQLARHYFRYRMLYYPS